jgi:hypothetical protein
LVYGATSPDSLWRHYQKDKIEHGALDFEINREVEQIIQDQVQSMKGHFGAQPRVIGIQSGVPFVSLLNPMPQFEQTQPRFGFGESGMMPW